MLASKWRMVPSVARNVSANACSKSTAVHCPPLAAAVTRVPTFAASAFANATTRRLASSATSPRRRLPHLRDPRQRKFIEQALRVDHAGEYGAVRIYDGQLAVLRSTSVGPTIEEMRRTEVEHLETMNELIADRRVRPTVLLPLWDLAGFALGAGTALLGKEAAMACTVAVETVIGEHYNDQVRAIIESGDVDDELKEVFKRHRDEELEHHDEALELGAQQAPFYEALSSVIKAGCHAAIFVAKRV